MPDQDACFRRLFETSFACRLVLSPDLTIVAATDAFLAATMTKRDEIVGRKLFDVFPDNPADPSADGVRNLRRSLERVLADKRPDRMAVQQYDVRRPTEDGGEFETRFWRPVNSAILDSSGRVEYLLNDVEDVTELTQRERRLVDAQAANEQLRLFIEHAPASLAMLDHDMRYLRVSERWRSDYQLSEGDVAGRSHYELFPELSETWRSVHQRALAGEVVTSPPDGERFVRPDGAERWIRWEVRPWRDSDGKIGGIVIFSEDITATTTATQDVRRLGQWLRVALGAANAGAWQWDTTTNENRWSDEVWDLYGLDRASVTPSFDAWRSALVPEDRDLVVKEVLAAAKERRDLSIEFRVGRKGGGVRHVLARAQHVAGKAGDSYVGIVIDVSERKALEGLVREHARDELLREQTARSEERYRDLLDAAPDAMFVVDRDGSIALVNVQAERMFGYTRDELVGQPLTMLIPESSQGVHARHVERFFHDPSARPMASGVELAGRLKDGKLLPVEVSLGPVRTQKGLAVSAAVRDITDRRRLAAAAKLMAQRLTSAVESMDDAFALFDDAQRLVLCNNPYRRIVGYPDDAPLDDKTGPELAARFAETLAFGDEAARAGFLGERAKDSETNSEQRHDEVRTRDGRTLRVMSRRTLEGGIVTTVWDLTAEEQRNDELRRAHAAAAAGSAAKTEFLSSMSHELRTPLNAVLGFAQLLERDRRQPLTDRQHERVRRILSGGEQLLRLIDDILDLARIEAGQVAVSIEPVRVSDVIGEVKRTLEPMEAACGIEITLDAPAEDIPLIAVDRMRYAQILTNFCSNALKYNRRGGTVHIRVQHVERRRVRVTVTDNGFGIPRSKQDLLFQPFQRAGQETGPIEGTGIGLVITRKLASMMNAEVGFESEEGRGSSFWVDAPAYAAMKRDTERPLPPHPPAEPSSPAVVKNGHAHRTVLYIEDNPENVAFVTDVMGLVEPFEIELVTASSAEEGVELAIARHPDAILMDINLAGEMNGVEALRVLASSSAKDIPVIALTAAASARDRERALAAGFRHYLTKPVNVDELVRSLGSILERDG